MACEFVGKDLSTDSTNCAGTGEGSSFVPEKLRSLRDTGPDRHYTL
jgi:hypothetical protein